MKWSKERIIETIQNIKARGEPITPSYLGQKYRYLYKAMAKYFGDGSKKIGWEKAVLMAKFDINKERGYKVWTREKIINSLKKIKSKKKPISIKHLKRCYSSLLYRGIINYYRDENKKYVNEKKCWEKALLDAGFDPHKEKGTMCWNKEKIISEIKKLDAKGKPIYPTYLFKNYPQLYSAIRRYFGNGSYTRGWKNAITAAGFDPNSKYYEIKDK